MILFLNLFRFCKIFIHQILNPLTYLLLLAAGIIFFTGSKLDCFIILAILLLSAILGAIQSYRTDNIILKQSKLFLEASLKQLSFFILILITATCILLLILGLLTGKIWSELFSMLIALFICMVPEGLPIALKLSASTNIFQKVVLFFFATNLGQVLIVFGLLILKLPIPILAPQFLWLNIVTDGFLCTALALEPVSAIQLKDEQFSAVIINRQIIYQMICMALTAAIVGIFVFLYYYFYQNNLAKAQTAVFLVVVLCQLFNVWSCYAGSKSLFKVNLLGNQYLVAASILVFILQVLIIYLPFMQIIFKTTTLTSLDFIGCFLLSSLILLVKRARN